MVFNQITSASLINSGTREDLLQVFIVVDADQIGQMSFGSLSDYLAFVALTQVDPQIETVDVETVLNLFAGQDQARLSPWDRDYLQALYDVSNTPFRPFRQVSRIASSIAKRRANDTIEGP